jgi:methylmalonyl-CoA mutase
MLSRCKNISTIKSTFRRLSSYPQQWEKLASKEIGNKDPKTLEWKSPEGIVIKPLYTNRGENTDLTEEEAPGVYPFKRGPYATMYTAKP